MRTAGRLALVLAIASTSMMANHLYGNIIGNMWCISTSCTAASQSCWNQASACTWCNGGPSSAGFCVIKDEKTCDSTGDEACGSTYSGYCYYGVCTGNDYVNDNCKQPKCVPPQEPPTG